jgi:hypothetical protein
MLGSSRVAAQLAASREGLGSMSELQVVLLEITSHRACRLLFMVNGQQDLCNPSDLFLKTHIFIIQLSFSFFDVMKF